MPHNNFTCVTGVCRGADAKLANCAVCCRSVRAGSPRRKHDAEVYAVRPVVAGDVLLRRAPRREQQAEIDAVHDVVAVQIGGAGVDELDGGVSGGAGVVI